MLGGVIKKILHLQKTMLELAFKRNWLIAINRVSLLNEHKLFWCKGQNVKSNIILK